MTWTPRNGDSSGLLLRFLGLSVLLHLLLLAIFSSGKMGSEPRPPPAIVVDLGPMPPKSKAQTIPKARSSSPSATSNDQAPKGPAFLSDRDNTVDRQTLARGVPNPGEPPPPQAPTAASEPGVTAPAIPPAAPKNQAATELKPETPEAPAAAKPAPKEAPAPPAKREALKPAGVLARRAEAAPPAAPLPGLDRLLPPSARVLGARPSQAQTETAARQAKAVDPRRDLLGAPPPARAGLLAGLRGNFDDLPDVAAGSITMLNTKADRFAPFVRRIGTRVFENLLIHQRRDLGAPEVLSARELVTVRAILDDAGRLKSLEVTDRSGSAAMDQTLMDALREGAFDHNPPREAANPQGDFEFIFQAQIAADVVPGPRGPQIRQVESRLRIGLL